MAALQADSQGFLTGTPIKLDHSEFSRAITLWQDIRTDVAAIRQAVYREVQASAKSKFNGTAANAPAFKQKRSGPAVLPQRNEKGQFVKAAAPGQKRAMKEAAVAAVAAVEAVQAAKPSRKGRDVSSQLRGPGGRFLSAEEKQLIREGRLNPADLPAVTPSRRSPGGGSRNGGNGGGEGLGVGGALIDVGAGAVHAADGVDPTVAAAKEVHAVLSPLSSPVVGLGKRLLGIGGDVAERSVPWYRRIWNELRELNKRNEEAGHGGGLLGLLASLAVSIALLPVKLVRALLRVPGALFGGGKGLVGGFGRAIFGSSSELSMLGKIGRALKGGTLLASLFAGGEIWQTEHDNTLSREQKTKKNFGTVGEAAGSVLGGALGSLLGPVGTIGGAAAGGWLGKMVGDWLYQFDWKAIGKEIVDDWHSVTDGFHKLIDPLVDKAKQAASVANAAIKGATGVDVAATAGSAYQGAKKLAASAWEKLGSLSAKYEGKTGSANKDNVGYAYGKYQFNSAKGGLAQFFKDNPEYAAKFKGLTPGTPEFAAKWREVAKTDSAAFEAAQDKSARNLWYAPAAGKAGELGYRMDDRGIQEAVFSGSINHGGINKILAAAAATPGFKDMSPQQQLQAFYAARRAYVQKNVAQKDLGGLMSRYAKEERDALALSTSVPRTALPVNLDNVRMSNVPSVPSGNVTPAGASVQVSTAPSEVMPLASSGKGQAVAVVPPAPAAGQNMNDRAIAHIATGGLGSHMGGR